jgi:hypothetical protein
MLALPDMLYFLVNEFSSLRRGGFALSSVFSSPLKCLLFGHESLLATLVHV